MITDGELEALWDRVWGSNDCTDCPHLRQWKEQHGHGMGTGAKAISMCGISESTQCPGVVRRLESRAVPELVTRAKTYCVVHTRRAGDTQFDFTTQSLPEIADYMASISPGDSLLVSIVNKQVIRQLERRKQQRRQSP